MKYFRLQPKYRKFWIEPKNVPGTLCISKSLHGYTLRYLIEGKAIINRLFFVYYSAESGHFLFLSKLLAGLVWVRLGLD